MKMMTNGTALDMDQVRSLAYNMWEKEGRPHGRDMDHWNMAMEAMMAKAAAKPAAKKAPAKTAAKKAPAKKKK